eukprot:scaffold2929_cov343-Prasinococcus_capsulatus_cf.AAC.2
MSAMCSRGRKVGRTAAGLLGHEPPGHALLSHTLGVHAGLELDDVQLQYALSLLGDDSGAAEAAMRDSSERGGGNGSSSNKLSGETLSQISYIKDMLPYLGEGFLAMCLTELGSTEAVVNAVLEGALPSSLKGVDQALSLDAYTAKSTPVQQPDGGASRAGKAPAGGAPSRGKAKLDYSNYEEIQYTPSNPGGKLQHDVKHLQLSKSNNNLAQLSQKKKVNRMTDKMLSKGREDSAAYIRANMESLLQEEDEYDDEYDDSYDELNFSIDASGATDDDSSTKAAATGPQQPSAGKLRSFWMMDGKVYQYARPGATEVKARSQEEAVALAKQKAAEVVLVHCIESCLTCPTALWERVLSRCCIRTIRWYAGQEPDPRTGERWQRRLGRHSQTGDVAAPERQRPTAAWTRWARWFPRGEPWRWRQRRPTSSQRPRRCQAAAGDE